MNYDSPGGGNNDDDVHWFDDIDMFDPSTDLGDGELSRQGDRLVTIRSYGSDTHLMFYCQPNCAKPDQPANPRSKCATKSTRKARAKCLKAAKRVKALKKCKQIKAKSARARCIRKVNRRYR